jgi:hypothetical protein
MASLAAVQEGAKPVQRIRTFFAEGADGFGRTYEVDSQTLRPIGAPRRRIVFHNVDEAGNILRERRLHAQ